jgi:hypothetical protein
MKRKIKLILSLTLLSCNGFYGAGSRTPGIDLEIKSKIRTSLIFRYLDSPVMAEHKLPEKFSFLKNGGDLEYFPESSKSVYFKNHPEEVYQIGLSGVTLFEAAFIPSINNKDMLYKSDINKIDSVSFDRFELRMDTIYKKILLQALKDGVPDSLIYIYKKPFLLSLKRPWEK